MRWAAQVAPPGLYIDRIIDVAREELAEECDYALEAGYQSRFHQLLADDPVRPAPAPVLIMVGRTRTRVHARQKASWMR